MPSGNALLLGRVLLMYWHKMTRIIRDLLYLDVGPLIDQALVIESITLTQEELSARKYLFL